MVKIMADLILKNAQDKLLKYKSICFDEDKRKQFEHHREVEVLVNVRKLLDFDSNVKLNIEGLDCVHLYIYVNKHKIDITLDNLNIFNVIVYDIQSNTEIESCSRKSIKALINLVNRLIKNTSK